MLMATLPASLMMASSSRLLAATRHGVRRASCRRLLASLLAAALLLSVLALPVPASAASASSAPAFSVTPEGESPQRGALFGVRPSSTSRLAAPLPLTQRFNLQNFLPASAETTQTNEQARVADYTFLRSLETPALRGNVGQAPNRDYAKIQQQLAAEQKQQEAALSGWGNLSAVLFGAAGAGAAAPLVSGVNYLTPTQIAAISGWQTAKASWYGPGFYGGQTADGTTFTATSLLVANQTLPLGTKVAISYGGRTVIVPVQDRGPYVAGRDFDLSAGLANALGFSGVQYIRWAIVP